MARRLLLPARNTPSLADYQPASGTWSASTAGESKLTGTDRVGAVTKERTSHTNPQNIVFVCGRVPLLKRANQFSKLSVNQLFFSQTVPKNAVFTSISIMRCGLTLPCVTAPTVSRSDKLLLQLTCKCGVQ